MFQKLENNNIDLLFASRYEKPEGGSDDDNFVTLVGNYFFTSLGNLLFRLKYFRYIIYLCNGKNINV